MADQGSFRADALHTHRAAFPPVLALMGRVVSLFTVALFVTATPIILTVEFLYA